MILIRNKNGYKREKSNGNNHYFRKKRFLSEVHSDN